MERSLGEARMIFVRAASGALEQNQVDAPPTSARVEWLWLWLLPD